MMLQDEDGNESTLGDVISGLSDSTTHKDRPFTGQPHTDQGERGMTEIKGIRFRDLADCVVKAMFDSLLFTMLDCGRDEEHDKWQARVDDGTLNYNDVYMLDFGKIDPLALQQNICCRVEKAMGIFPNVPRLKADDS